MKEQIKLILKYQEIDGAVKKIEDEIAKSEEYKMYMSARKFLQTVSDSISQIDSKSEKLLISYNGILQKMQELKSIFTEQNVVLDDCKNEEELEYFNKRFKLKSEELSRLESQLINVIKEMEELNKEYITLAKNNKQMREQYAKYKPLFEELRNAKNDEVKKLKESLLKLEKEIDDEILEKYKAKRKDKKFPIVFEINLSGKGDSYCPACGNSISVQVKEQLEGGNILECETCRRFIYSVKK